MKKTFIKHTIKAFSVMEAVVGMVVTAVVIGIAYVLFSIVSERMENFRIQNLVIADINRFTYSVNKDMFESETLIQKENELIFKLISDSTITYSINENYTLRKNNTFIDTFNFSIQDVKFDTIRDANKQYVFQRVEVKVNNNEEKIRFKFFKRIYPNQLIEKEIFHEN